MTNNLIYAINAYPLENYLPIHEPATAKLCPTISSPEENILAEEQYQSLSDDAKEVIDIVLYPPEALERRLQIKNRKTLSQGKLSEFLRLVDSKRWKYSKIDAAFKEIKKFLKEV